MKKNWIVTGASSGLGQEIARLAAARGDGVVGTVRSAQQAAALERDIPGIVAVIGDLTVPGTPQALVRQAMDRLGDIDILVNNAGRGFTAAVEEASDAEIRSVFELNFFAQIAMIQSVLPQMRQRRSGTLVNVTSISGFKPWSGTGIYCASKFAMEGLGQTLAQEVASMGIRVMNVQPGGLRTNFNGASLGASQVMIEDYDQTAHIARRALANAHGKQPGNPHLAATIVLAALDAEKLPLNLLLGSDAYSMARSRINELLGDMNGWEESAAAIGFTAETAI
ncbi:MULTISPECIES: SDR family NAD(P)-dependent oxidoreductase [unclassified Sphingobium]|uniref:SDR family NAD(P)-dependent oxidoreductase n=1 Tax=unclassified Sphingobium TaxID=2611147 RepID=UPI00076FF11E|nr:MULTISPECIES: SDR family NAD(P)-dependent oxidoreductase [unclassified Sphingobium]AMK21504.1 short-chain dehydrogenase/reductase sdr [Sphingobium sp. TKS]NML91871.1 SDR family NAD(P)-dependent oxidoreductase [Sphingobium sp. TB-6]